VIILTLHGGGQRHLNERQKIRILIKYETSLLVRSETGRGRDARLVWREITSRSPNATCRSIESIRRQASVGYRSSISSGMSLRCRARTNRSKAPRLQGSCCSDNAPRARWCLPEAFSREKSRTSVGEGARGRRENKLRWLTSSWHRYSYRGAGLRIISFKCLRTGYRHYNNHAVEPHSRVPLFQSAAKRSHVGV